MSAQPLAPLTALELAHVHNMLAKACACGAQDIPGKKHQFYSCRYLDLHLRGANASPASSVRNVRVRCFPNRLHAALAEACQACWSLDNSNGRDYSLRILAAHRRWADQFDLLYELARDEEFLAAQEEGFSDAPESALDTLMTALAAACDVADVGASAEFCLRHAEREEEKQHASPWDWYLQGKLERSLRLVSRLEPSRRISWLLHMLHAAHPAYPDRVERIMREIGRVPLPRLENWEAKMAIPRLLTCAMLDGASAVVWADKLLTDKDKSHLVSKMCQHGDLSVPSLALSRTILNERDRAYALLMVGQAPGSLRRTEILDALKEAVERSRGIDSKSRTDVLVVASQSMRALGMPEALEVLQEAIENARTIDDDGSRAEALAAVGGALGTCGHPEALVVLREAFKSAREIREDNEDRRANALRAVGKAFGACRRSEAAIVLQEVLRSARAIRAVYIRAPALVDICRVLGAFGGSRAAGFLRAVLTSGRTIRDMSYRADVLVAVSQALGACGGPDAVDVLQETLNYGRVIQDERKHTEVLVAVGQALGICGQSSALEILREGLKFVSENRISGNLCKILCAAAHGLGASGRPEAAEVLQGALVIARANLYGEERREALCAVGFALGDCARHEATDVLREALASTRGIYEEPTRAYSLSRMCKALSASRQLGAAIILRDALEIARAITYQGRHAKSLEAVAEALGASGGQDAVDVLRETMKSALAIDRGYERDYALLAVVGALDACDGPEAMTVLRMALESICETSYEGDRALSLSAVGQALKNCGRSEAVEVSREVERTRSAIQYGESFSSKLGRSADAWFEVSGREREALNKARSNSDDESRAESLTKICLVLRPDDPKALEILQDVLEVGSAIGVERIRAKIMATITETQLNMGMPKEALLTSNLILESRPRHLSELARLCAYGSVEVFMTLFPSFAESLSSAWAAVETLAKLYPNDALEIYRGIYRFEISSQKGASSNHFSVMKDS